MMSPSPMGFQPVRPFISGISRQELIEIIKKVLLELEQERIANDNS